MLLRLPCSSSISVERVRRAHAKGCQPHPAGTHNIEGKIPPHDSRCRGPPMRDSGVRESFSPSQKPPNHGPHEHWTPPYDQLLLDLPTLSTGVPGSTTGQWATLHDREPLLGLNTSTTVIRLLCTWRPYNPRNQPPCGPCHVTQRIQGSACGERRVFASYLWMSDLRGNEVLNDTGNARLRGK